MTGAMMANFTALAAARHSVLQKHGWDVEVDGLCGSPPVTVIVGEQAHPTLLKAVSLLGFGCNRLVRVPVDEQGRMRADAIPTTSGPGNTILNDVALNQVLVCFGSEERTKRVLKAIQDDGTCWCGTASWLGKTAMRISVSSWATTDDDVERSLSAILRIAAAL